MPLYYLHIDRHLHNFKDFKVFKYYSSYYSNIKPRCFTIKKQSTDIVNKCSYCTSKPRNTTLCIKAFNVRLLSYHFKIEHYIRISKSDKHSTSFTDQNLPEICVQVYSFCLKLTLGNVGWFPTEEILDITSNFWQSDACWQANTKKQICQ